MGKFTVYSRRNSIRAENPPAAGPQCGPAERDRRGALAAQRPLCLHNSAALCTHNACGGCGAIAIEARRDRVRRLAVGANVRVG